MKMKQIKMLIDDIDDTLIGLEDELHGDLGINCTHARSKLRELEELLSTDDGDNSILTEE